MKRMQSFLAVLLLTGIVGVSAAPAEGQEGVLLRARLGNTNYCHMKFPTIREDTLYWDRPVLKDPSSGDIVDYYGSCGHDPLGKDEVLLQRRLWEQRQSPE